MKSKSKLFLISLSKKILSVSIFIAIFLAFASLLSFPTTTRAAASVTKTIGGCPITAFFGNNKGVAIKSIKKNTDYSITAKWNYDIAGNCNYNAIEVGYIRGSGAKAEKYPQDCYVEGKLTTTQMVAFNSGFNSGDQSVLYKYVKPKKGPDVCFADEKTTIPDKDILILELSVGASTGGGGGGGGTKDPPTKDPPKDPPTQTTAVCVSKDANGKEVKKTIDLSKGEKCPGGTIVCPQPDGSTKPVQPDGFCPKGSGTPPSVAQLYNPIQSDSLIGLGFSLMKGFLGAVAALAIVFIVMGAFRLVVSRGNPEAVTRGKDILIWSIAGLTVALMAFSLTAIVQNLLGAF